MMTIVNNHSHSDNQYTCTFILMKIKLHIAFSQFTLKITLLRQSELSVNDQVDASTLKIYFICQIFCHYLRQRATSSSGCKLLCATLYYM